MYVPNALFYMSETFSLPAAGLSSRNRPRGTQGGRVYTRRKFGPRPGSVARALGVQSHAISQVITGFHFASAEPRRTMEIPNLSFFLRHCCWWLYHVYITPSFTTSHSTLWQPRYNSSRTSSSSCCDGHGPCIYLCVRVCHVFSCRPRN